MSVTSSPTPTHQLRRYRYPIVLSSATALGIRVLLAPHAAADKWGSGYLIPDSSGVADASHIGAYTMHGSQSLGYRAVPELAGPDPANGNGSATPVTAASDHKVPGVKLEVHLKTERDQGGLTVTKTAAVTGTPLRGVAFEAKDASGAAGSAGKTDSKGVWQTGDPTVSTYTAHEVEAAEGCQLSEHQKVTITAGKTTSVTGNDAKAAKIVGATGTAGAAATSTPADWRATSPAAPGDHAIDVTDVLGPGSTISEVLRIPALGKTWAQPAYESAACGGSS